MKLAHSLAITIAEISSDAISNLEIANSEIDISHAHLDRSPA
jgi:hypothetical protein